MEEGEKSNHKVSPNFVNTVCCHGCLLWDMCEAKWYRGERNEQQFCCPSCRNFSTCNPLFPLRCSRNFNKSLLKFIDLCVSSTNFISAHHFSLFLSESEEYILPTLRELFIKKFIKNADLRIINEGKCIFSNILKYDPGNGLILINLAYMESFLDIEQADQLILKSTQEEFHFSEIVQYYVWLGKYKVADRYERLRRVAIEANEIALIKFCKEYDALIELSKSNEINQLVELPSRIECFLANYEDISNINSVINPLAGRLDKIARSFREEARRYSNGSNPDRALDFDNYAISIYKIFMKIKPWDGRNLIAIVDLLDHIKGVPNYLRIDKKKINDEITLYSNKAIEKIKSIETMKFDECAKYGRLFRILGEAYKENNLTKSKECFTNSLEYYDHALSIAKFDKPDPKIELRLRQTITLDRVISLRFFGRYDESIEIIDDVLRKYPDWYQGYLRKGDVLKEKGDYDKAEKAYEKCQSLRPFDLAAYEQLILLYEDKDDLQAAIKTVVKLIRLRPIKMNKFAQDYAFFRLAKLKKDAGRLKSAMKLYEYILRKRQPDHLEVHDRLANLYMQTANWTDAIRILEGKIGLPDNVSFTDYNRLGECYGNLGEKERSQVFSELFDSEKGLSKDDPRAGKIYFYITKFYEQKMQYAEAIRYWIKLMRLTSVRSNEDHANYGFFRLARLKEDAGRLNSAIKLYNYILMKRQPDHAEVHDRLANLYILTLNWTNAIRVLEGKIILPGNDPSNDLKRLDTCYENFGKNGIADLIIEYENLLNTIPPNTPSYPDTCIKLINYYIKSEFRGNAPRAMELVRSANCKAWKRLALQAEILKYLDNNDSEALVCRKEIFDLPELTEKERDQNIYELSKWLSPVRKERRSSDRIYQMIQRNINLDNIEKMTNKLFQVRYTDIFESIARYSLMIRDCRQAVRYYDALLSKINDRDRIYLSCKSEALIGLNKYDEAELILNNLISFSNDARAMWLMGEIARKRGKLEEANQWYRRAYERAKDAKDDRGIMPALNRLIKSAHFSKDHEAVINLSSELLNIDNRDHRIRAYRAFSYIITRNYAEGLRDFRQILLDDPTNAFAVHLLISAFGFQNGPTEDPLIEQLVHLLDSQSNPTNISKYQQNLYDRLTEKSIFMDFKLAASVFNRSAAQANNFILGSLCHHFMKATVYLYYHDPNRLSEFIKNTITLFISQGDPFQFRDLLAEYWGSEKSSYFQFLLDIFQNDIAVLYDSISSLDIDSADQDDIQRVIDGCQSFQNRISSLYKPLNYNIPDRFDFLNPEFSADDFICEGLSIERLCDAINIDGYLSNCIHVKRETFNKVLDVPDLIDRYDAKDDFLHDYTDLNKYINNLKKFNRRLLERVYKDETPKRELIHYSEHSYEKFHYANKNPWYWNAIKKRIPLFHGSDDTNIISNCLDYTLVQLNNIHSLALDDLRASIGPYHEIKIILRAVCDAKYQASDITALKTQIDMFKKQKDILTKKCKYCRATNMAFNFPSEVVNNVKDKFQNVDIDDADLNSDDLCFFDLAQVQDCVENLVRNALKEVKDKQSMSGGTTPANVKLKFSVCDGHFEIICEDNGNGMSEEMIQKYLAGKISDDGVGVKSILRTVINHNANIQVDSKENCGTKIIITFTENEV